MHNSCVPHQLDFDFGDGKLKGKRHAGQVKDDIPVGDCKLKSKRTVDEVKDDIANEGNKKTKQRSRQQKEARKTLKQSQPMTMHHQATRKK